MLETIDMHLIKLQFIVAPRSDDIISRKNIYLLNMHCLTVWSAPTEICNSGYNFRILIDLHKVVLPVSVYYSDFIIKKPCTI